MAGSSEEDRRRQRDRYREQMRHEVSREEELARRQRRKQRRAARRGDGTAADDDEVTFAKMRPRPSSPARTGDAPVADGATRRGVVTAVHLSRVEVDDRPVRLAPALHLDPSQRLVVGDEVALDSEGDPPRAVARLPRRNRLTRPDPGNPHDERVLCANVDVAVIVAAAVDPPLRPGLIDRLLVALQRSGIAPLVFVNKVDLLDAAGRDTLAHTLAPYGELGVPVLRGSVANGDGVDALRAAVRGRTCVFVGHSGVGKSSLLNALDPDGARRIGAVRRADGRGRHTTTASRLWRLADGTAVIDTPGVRAFGLAELTADELAAAFADVVAFAAGCRFADCSHRHEPDCAVRRAVASGQLAAARYRSWLRLGDDDTD